MPAALSLAERADAQTRYEHALLQLFTGNESSYRDVSEELVKQFGGSPELKTRLYVVRACVIGLRPVGEPADLVRKAESLVARASVPWHLGLAGRAYLHAGDYEKAELPAVRRSRLAPDRHSAYIASAIRILRWPCITREKMRMRPMPWLLPSKPRTNGRSRCLVGRSAKCQLVGPIGSNS